MNFDTFKQAKILLKEKKSGVFGVHRNFASGVNHNSFYNSFPDISYINIVSVNLIGYIIVFYLLIVNSYASVHIARHV